MYDPSWFKNADTATRTLSVWVGVICMLLAMVPALFLPSRSTKDDAHLVPLNLHNIGGGMREILLGFKDAFGSVPFRKLCYATFLIFNAFNTVGPSPSSSSSTTCSAATQRRPASGPRCSAASAR